MAIVTTHWPNAKENRIIEEMASEGFEAAIKDYAPGATEPHEHDYDVCLYILEGEFTLREVATSIIHRFGPGDKIVVDRGTVHAEEHGPLKMVVGRRH